MVSIGVTSGWRIVDYSMHKDVEKIIIRVKAVANEVKGAMQVQTLGQSRT